MLFLAGLDDPRDGEVVVQRFAASPVDVAHRGAHLGVAVGVDLLFQKIDQATIAAPSWPEREGRARRGFQKGRFNP